MVQAGFSHGKDGQTAADLLERFGPTLFVDVGLRSRSPAGETPDLPSKNVKALIDTGAGGNCIDEALALDLRLPITDEGWVSGIGGKTWARMYTARLYVPKLNRLLFQPFAGVHLQAGDQWHGVILGRPFLRPYVMTYDATTGEVDIDPPADSVA